jgi:hypothetical protein
VASEFVSGAFRPRIQSAASYDNFQWKRAAVIRLQSTVLLVDILPQVGGKIAQIQDKASGHKLLIPPQRPYSPIPLDGDWLKHDTSGMDDCFPNVAAGAYPEAPWDSAILPDLGEWSHSSWKVRSWHSDELTMETLGHRLPYFAVKTIRFLDQRTIEFSYSVENRGLFPMRFIWSAHPLIAVNGKFELVLPPGDMIFRLFPPSESVYSWPNFKGKSVATDWVAHGTTLKIFVTGLAEGWCALVLPQYTLHFAFDFHVVPVVGIWFNNFGFPRDGNRPFRCIAVEPCTSPSDRLDNLGAHAYPTISPGGSSQWSMQLTVKNNE